MTQDQWNTCCDSAEMLDFLTKSRKLTERKARLLGCACCRSIWHLLKDERSRKAVEVAERFADGLANKEQLKTVNVSAHKAVLDHDFGPLWVAAAVAYEVSTDDEDTAYIAAATATAQAMYDDSATSWDEITYAAARTHVAVLLRDIVGNQFRPSLPNMPSLLTASNREPILHLAQIAYDERQMPQGTLDPANLGVLADALEEAGCPQADLVGHLRSDGPHVRGCFALDWVLGRA